MDKEQEILNFCRKVTALRQAHGLSVREMAKRLGVSEKTIRSVESGFIPPRLSCSILFRIEREFGVPPKDMFSPFSDDKFASS